MNRYALLLLAPTLLSGCSLFGPKHVKAPAEVPPATEIIRDPVLVPVPCSEVVELVDSDSNGMATSDELEAKVYKLTRSDAQHRINLNKLESAAIRCGVKVVHVPANGD